jgi:hypothetical protein
MQDKHVLVVSLVGEKRLGEEAGYGNEEGSDQLKSLSENREDRQMHWKPPRKIRNGIKV